MKLKPLNLLELIVQAVLWLATGFLFLVSAQGQMPPPPPTNIVRHFSPPSAVRTKVVVEFEYTNVVYPFFVSSNLTGTNWTLATNVGCVTVSAVFPLDPAVAAKFYTVGCPVYYGPAGATNSF